MIEKKNKASKNMSLFFVGHQSGAVWYANESKCDELCKLSCAVISIMFYQQTQSLVLITENYDMRLARLSNNLTSPEKKVRLSLSSDAKVVRICWIEPCSFGITSWDNIVRIWNLKEDSNYSLNLSDINREGVGVAFMMGSQREITKIRLSAVNSARLTRLCTVVHLEERLWLGKIHLRILLQIHQTNGEISVTWLWDLWSARSRSEDVG